MKFRLKIGHFYGPLNPELNSGRTYGMLMVPWIKTARDYLGTGLKETKSLADFLRASTEDANGVFKGAEVTVDTAMFPFLVHVPLPLPNNAVVDFIDEKGEFEPGLACIVGNEPYEGNPSIKIVKDALYQLIELHKWDDVRRLAEVLMDIEDAQSV
jgi:hypothetical protein